MKKIHLFGAIWDYHIGKKDIQIRAPDGKIFVIPKEKFVFDLNEWETALDWVKEGDAHFARQVRNHEIYDKVIKEFIEKHLI